MEKSGRLNAEFFLLNAENNRGILIFFFFFRVQEINKVDIRWYLFLDLHVFFFFSFFIHSKLSFLPTRYF